MSASRFPGKPMKKYMVLTSEESYSVEKFMLKDKLMSHYGK